MPQVIKDYLKDVSLPAGCEMGAPVWRTDAWGTHRNLQETFTFLRPRLKPKFTIPIEEYLPEPWFTCLKAMVIWLRRSQSLGAARITAILGSAKSFAAFWETNPQPCLTLKHLRNFHFTRYEDFLKQRVKRGELTQGGAREAALGLEKLALFLNHFDLTQSRIVFRQTFKRPTSTYEYKLVRKDSSDANCGNDAIHKKKRLDLDIVFALGNLFHTVENRIDRFFIAMTLILAVTGFRLSEFLSLTADCLNEYDQDGDKSLEIKYYPEKGGEPYSKQISPSAASYVNECFGVIYEFTTAGRAQAARLSIENSVIPSDHGMRKLLTVTTSQLAEALGIPITSVLRLTKAARLPIQRRNRHGEHSFDVVEALKAVDTHYLTARSARANNYEPVIRRLADGSAIFLHKALLVTLCYEISSKKTPLMFMPRRISEVTFGRWLGNVCERYEIKDSIGRHVQINSHQFRHLLNTLYIKGGLTDVEIARIFGRKDVRQNRTYNQLTPRERRDQLIEDIREDRSIGVVTDTYKDLKLISLEEAEQFLEAVIEAIHFTEFGVCVLDWARQPCPHHLNCLTGRDGKACRHLAIKKGDLKSLVQIEALLRNTKVAQSKALEADGPFLKDWLDHNEVLIINLEELRKIHRQAIAEGTQGEIVHPFPDGASREAIIAAKDEAEMSREAATG